jgi:hypothetical protein
MRIERMGVLTVMNDSLVLLLLSKYCLLVN